MRSVSVLLRGRPEDGSPSPQPPTSPGWGNLNSIGGRATRARHPVFRTASITGLWARAAKVAACNLEDQRSP